MDLNIKAESFFYSAVEMGLSPQIIYLLLIIPLIVMVATITRHILGFKVISVFSFVAMTAFLAFFIEGDPYVSILIGGLLLNFIYFFSYFIKKISLITELHYFARISLLYSLISIVFLLILAGLTHSPRAFQNLNLSQIATFLVLTGVILSEVFSSNQTQKGFRRSRISFFFTLIISMLLSLLITWDIFAEFIFHQFYVSFIFVILTFLAGRYKGLRFTEFIRFKSIKTDSLED